jgi:hypothetical protein
VQTQDYASLRPSKVQGPGKQVFRYLNFSAEEGYSHLELAAGCINLFFD